MLRRWRARHKMRWAVRRWKLWSPKQRVMFAYYRGRRRMMLLQKEIAAVRTTLYGDDPLAASTMRGLPFGHLARERLRKTRMEALKRGVAQMDVELGAMTSGWEMSKATQEETDDD